MKKAITALTACALSSMILLCGCSPTPKSHGTTTPTPPVRSDTREATPDPIDENFGVLPNRSRALARIELAFRHSPSGVYTVEYIHSPRDEQPDDTLDYRLTLNGDNTFTLTATAKGVTAEHYGHWYARHGGEVTMYYDEPIDQSAHNVYVSDYMYAELLPHGKIMLYDNCNVIVLARATDNENNIETREMRPYTATPRRIDNVREIPPPSESIEEPTA